MRQPPDRPRQPLLLLVGLAVIVPGLLVEVQARPAISGSSAALEAFLGQVRAATPPGAALCAVAETFVAHRAAYLLSPRPVCLLLAPDVDGSAALGRAGFWRALPERARRRGARYLLGWGLPRLPAGRVRVRSGPGVLVDLGP